MWSLSKVHQIGELVAAIAVVVSLVFVGYEVQQNNQTHVQSATQALLRDYATTSRTLSGDAEMACIYIRGNQDFESLNELDKFRYSSHALSVYRTVQAMHNLMLEGALDADEWASIDSITRGSLTRPGTRQWLATRRDWFTDDFQAYLEDAISRADTTELADYDPEGCVDLLRSNTRSAVSLTSR